MTTTPASSGEMDHLDQLGAKAFDGFLVRKDLVRKYSRQYPVPTYVVEFLLCRYYASTDPAAGDPEPTQDTPWALAEAGPLRDCLRRWFDSLETVEIQEAAPQEVD